MRKSKYLILSLCLLVMGGKAFADNFTEKQTAIIHNEAIKLLQRYQQLSNQLADNVVDIDNLNKTSQSLIDLFVNRKSIIFNDLDPSYKLSETYELETYIANLLLWYPDGMKITIDFSNLKAGNILSHGNDIFTVDIMTTKKNDGNYLNKQRNTQTENLLYRIAFFQKNSSLENFKIAGIRSTKATKVADDSKLLAEVKSIEFSEKDMQLIKDQTRFLLNDYINFLNLLSDPKETPEDKSYYGISFVGLFKDSTLNIANDIVPNPDKRWVSVKEYKETIKSDYPEGIRNLGMNLDSAEFGKVIPEGKEKFYINGYIDKFFSGKYQAKTIYRDNAKYDFKVSFERDENTFKNFKLSNIDKFGVNLYNQTTETTKQELPQMPITSLKRKGLYPRVSFGGGLSNLSDPNLKTNEILQWNTEIQSAINMEASALYYLNTRLAVSAGIGYNRYSAKLSLNGTYRNTEYFTDINDELYLKNVTAAYDSVLTFNYLSIPITAVFHSNTNPETWGFYAEAGFIASINVNSTYHTTGNFATSGYYEQYPLPLQTIVAPEFGFVNRQNIDSKGKSNAAPILMSAVASFGVSYPLNYFTTVFAGPELALSFTNVAKAGNVADAFGTTSSAKSVGISKYGIKFGVSYKF